MILQLNPPIPIITEKGPALAHALIDYGPEHDIHWVCIQDGTGECWTWKNPQVRGQKNITHGRHYISPFYDPNDARLPAAPVGHPESDHICMICQRGNACDCEDEEDEEDNCDCEEEITYKELFMNERVKLVNIERELEKLKKINSEIEKKSDQINKTKNCIFELQDLLMSLIRHRKIELTEVEKVCYALRNSGVDESDLRVLALGKIGY